jgi:hypothetical protein
MMILKYVVPPHRVELLFRAEVEGTLEHARRDPGGEPPGLYKLGEPISAGLAMPANFLPVDVDVG